MTDKKKKRLSMLDNLAASPAPTPAPMMASSRPLRAARDAVDGHKVWDVDPESIVDDRVADRLDPADVADLRDSIETTGQSVPILLRRHPTKDGKFLLVYGRRRLEAIRSSDSVSKVRALIAHLDENSAVEAQISENMARRDLTYIEKALFAQELIDSGYGNQSRVAEVLTVTKSSISMALAVVAAVGPDLIRAIGPADGIGRPRWDALARGLERRTRDTDDLIDLAVRTRGMHEVEVFNADSLDDLVDPSGAAFDAVMHAIGGEKQALEGPVGSDNKPKSLRYGNTVSGRLRRTARGVQIELKKGDFADWVEAHAQDVIEELHQRFRAGSED